MSITNEITNFKEYLKDFYNLVKNYNFNGIKFLKCKIGYILERTSKKGTPFKGCSNYQTCKNAEF